MNKEFEPVADTQSALFVFLDSPRGRIIIETKRCTKSGGYVVKTPSEFCSDCGLGGICFVALVKVGVKPFRA